MLNVQASQVVLAREKQKKLLLKEAIQGYIAALEEDGVDVPKENFETLVVAV